MTRLLALGFLNVFDDVSNALKLFCFFLRNFGSKFFFQSHNQFYLVKGISSKVINETGLGSDLLFADIQLCDAKLSLLSEELRLFEIVKSQFAAQINSVLEGKTPKTVEDGSS